MKEERLRILKMVSEGKITPEQAAKLIEALEAHEGDTGRRTQRDVNASGKWLRINVTDAKTGRQRVNVRLPVRVVKFGSRLGARFMDLDDTRIDAVLEAVEQGATGRIIEVTDEEDGEHVVISIE